MKNHKRARRRMDEAEMPDFYGYDDDDAPIYRKTLLRRTAYNVLPDVLDAISGPRMRDSIYRWINFYVANYDKEFANANGGAKISDSRLEPDELEYLRDIIVSCVQRWADDIRYTPDWMEEHKDKLWYKQPMEWGRD